jgi:hypothetical protein
MLGDAAGDQGRQQAIIAWVNEVAAELHNEYRQLASAARTRQVAYTG